VPDRLSDQGIGTIWPTPKGDGQAEYRSNRLVRIVLPKPT
jgi:hypothetical protein